MEPKVKEREETEWLNDGRLAYRPKELAELVGMSVKSIYRAIERGELKAARVSNGTRLLVLAPSARAWLEDNLVEPRDPRAAGPRAARDGLGPAAASCVPWPRSSESWISPGPPATIARQLSGPGDAQTSRGLAPEVGTPTRPTR